MDVCSYQDVCDVYSVLLCFILDAEFTVGEMFVSLFFACFPGLFSPGKGRFWRVLTLYWFQAVLRAV